MPPKGNRHLGSLYDKNAEPHRAQRFTFCSYSLAELSLLSNSAVNGYGVNSVNNCGVNCILYNFLNGSLSLAAARCERDGCYSSEHQN